MGVTSIEWADKVWNCVTGCTKVSQGCKHCYAEVMAERFFARLYPEVEVPSDPSLRCGAPSQQWSTRPRVFTDVQCHPDRLDAPLRWRKSSRVFVNSMSDLFHESVPDAFIAAVFGIMASCPQHTFLILTKRPERARSWFAALSDAAATVTDGDGEVRWCIKHLDQHITRSFHCVLPVWPLLNVHLGVSVEDQATADQRIPILLQTPAVVRWVSYEPALGPVDFNRVPLPDAYLTLCGYTGVLPAKAEVDAEWDDFKYSQRKYCTLDWVVVGGESGPKARPCDVAWIRSVVEQCKAAAVPVFVKQLGAKSFYRDEWDAGPREGAIVQPRDRKGADQSEWPADLRVREFPEVRS